jgi:hypothetical protein
MDILYDGLEFKDLFKAVDTYIKEKDTVEDCLTIGVDFSPNDEEILVVSRIKGDEITVLNIIKNYEAVRLYRKLIGVSNAPIL